MDTSRLLKHLWSLETVIRGRRLRQGSGSVREEDWRDCRMLNKISEAFRIQGKGMA